MLANRGANVSFITNAEWAMIEFSQNNVYGHLEQVCKPIESFESESRHMF